MLKQIVIEMESLSKEKVSCSWGYLLYGTLLEKLEAEVAEYLHDTIQKPVSQFIIPKMGTNQAIWTLNLMNGYMMEKVLPFIRSSSEYNIRSKESLLRVKAIAEGEAIDEESFCETFFCKTNPYSSYEITFLTPCTFKTDNDYAVFPSASLVISSLCQRWNSISEKFTLQDDEAINNIVERTKIVRYNLKSSVFYMKGTKIPGFVGSIVLSTRGPEALIRLFNMLISFASYSGIGIKTALGMGAVRVRGIK